MGNLNRLPETPNDNEFLRTSKFDIRTAALAFQEWIGPKLTMSTSARTTHSVPTINAELVAKIKGILGLPVVPRDRGATITILNVINETERMVGYPDPELIFIKLDTRRQALLRTLPT